MQAFKTRYTLDSLSPIVTSRNSIYARCLQYVFGPVIYVSTPRTRTSVFRACYFMPALMIDGVLCRALQW